MISWGGGELPAKSLWVGEEEDNSSNKKHNEVSVLRDLKKKNSFKGFGVFKLIIVPK